MHAPGRGASLPRDTRDTLFLLAVIAWVVALQAAHIPAWTTALTGVLLAWRGWLALQARPLPGWPWRAGLLAVALAGTWASHGTLLGQNAGVTLVVVLLALKTLELRARRDAFVVFFLGFFALLTHFFYSQSLVTAAGILVALLGLLTAVVNAHMPVGRPPLAQAARIAAGMALMGAPIMLVLFLLFPRIAPLWGVPNNNPTGTSGLSEDMRVGDVAQLALDDSIALRVRFDGPPPPAALTYFRGPVLSRFDGRRWTQQLEPTALSAGLRAELRPRGEPLRYEVTLEPHQRRWLFVLEAATEAPELPGNRVRMTTDLQWVTQRPIVSLVRYRAQSHVDFGHGPLQDSAALREFVDLPPGFNPRTLQLAQDLRRVHGPGPQNAPALVDAVLERLRTGGFVYTLEPGVYGQHTADEFWFDRKAGFCEHFASAFAVLMRAMDIPARVVTGYQGGELNSVDGYWTVRQRDAHAWTEVWLQGRGWVRVDPTGAAVPSRIGSLQRLQAPVGAVAGALRAAVGADLIGLLRANWEALNNTWNQWVLNYTQDRQFELLRSLGVASPSWQDLALVLLAVVVVVSLVGAAWAVWERRRHDPWLRLLHHAGRRLTTLGLQASDRTPPRELARQLRERFAHDPAAAALADWLLRLEAQRYAPRSTTTLAELRREYRRLRWPPARGA
ncbi:transglutaminaseTgpA domain-containing protein [Hydrogenophaga sp. T2]|uniref:transglutaminase family protein n=1 Tax=Hydrogenophaga sp. T2 TaxID=3132823 RepID=UPI003CF76F9D